MTDPTTITVKTEKTELPEIPLTDAALAAWIEQKKSEEEATDK